LTAQNTADSELATKFQLGNVGLYPHSVWNCHLAIFNCFPPWRNTCFTCDKLLNVLFSHVWHNFLCI